jgi:hypothetical protein
MRPLERAVCALATCSRWVGLLVAAHAGAALAQAADDAAYRYSAPIAVERSAAFVQLPLPVSAYAHSAQASLQDLRVVDARGERVPFALLAPRAADVQTVEQQRAATLYPLPPRPAANGAWSSPVEVQVQGDRIRVLSKGKAASVTPGAARSGGWLIDLGERERNEPPPQSLRLQWSGPAEFTAPFGFETSDDLRSWRHGGQGQLMALASRQVGALTQPTVVLPAHAGRFVRLVWADAANAPVVTGASVIASHARSQQLDVPSELTFAASAEPVAAHAADDPLRARALHFDLGGVLPLLQVDVRLGSGTRVLPAQLQGRSRSSEPWRDLGGAVFYRLERGGEPSASPPLPLRTSLRYLRIVPDARAGAFDAASVQLVVQAALASVVFAAQGQPPFALQAGSSRAAASALPVSTLVPALDDERARFGRATLGAWTEVAAVARAEEQQQRVAALRPWLLWSVLLIGVAALGWMVWRLARERPSSG